MGAVDLTEQVDPDGDPPDRHRGRPQRGPPAPSAGPTSTPTGGTPWSATSTTAPPRAPRPTPSTGSRGDVDPFQVTGDRLTVTASGIDVPSVRALHRPRRRPGVGSAAATLEITLHYVTAGNASGSAAADFVVAAGRQPGDPVRARPRLRRGLHDHRLDVGRDADVVFDNRRLTFRASTSMRARRHRPARADLDRRPVSRRDGAQQQLLPRTTQPPRDLVVNRPDGLQIALLPSVTLELDLDSGAAVPVLVAGEAEPQALDLGGDDRATDVIGVAGRCRCVGSIGLLSDIRTSAVGSGPTVPAAEVQVVAAAGTPAGDARPGRRGHRHVVARPSARCATRSVRRYGGDAVGGVRPHRPRLRAGRPARAGRRGGAPPARLPPRRRLPARARHLDGARPVGPVAPSWSASPCWCSASSSPAAGWPSGCCSTGSRCSPCPPPHSRSTPRRTCGRWSIPAVCRAAAVVLVGGRARAVRAATTRPSLLREEEGR